MKRMAQKPACATVAIMGDVMASPRWQRSRRHDLTVPTPRLSVLEYNAAEGTSTAENDGRRARGRALHNANWDPILNAKGVRVWKRVEQGGADVGSDGHQVVGIRWRCRRGSSRTCCSRETTTLPASSIRRLMAAATSSGLASTSG